MKGVNKFVLIGALVLTGALFGLIQPVDALSFPSFGGKVVGVIPCTCSATGVVLLTSTPSIGSYLYMPVVSTLYSTYTPVPTAWVLGNYIPGAGVCLIGAPPACTPVPTKGLIRQLGTSLPGL